MTSLKCPLQAPKEIRKCYLIDRIKHYVPKPDDCIYVVAVMC